MPEMNFNSEEFEPLGLFEPLPVGNYTVIVESSERKPTKKGNGNYLQLVYSVVDAGEYNGRKIFDRFNLVNDNPSAVRIAQSALTSLCTVVGVPVLKNSEQLHNIPFMVYVKIRPGNEEFPNPTNDVKDYLTTDGIPAKDVRKGEGLPKHAAASPAAAGAAAAPAGKNKPWAAKK